jgi:hypothetical protein
MASDDMRGLVVVSRVPFPHLGKRISVVLQLPGSSGVDSSGRSLDRGFAVEAFDLQFVELYVELGDEVLKDIVIFVEHPGCLLISHDLRNVLVWPFEVWKQKNEHLHPVS